MMPSFLISSSSQLKIYFKHAYNYLSTYAIYLFFIPLILTLGMRHLSDLDFNYLYTTYAHHLLHDYPLAVAAISFLLSTLMATLYFLLKLLSPKKIYLLDFSCYNHDPKFTMSRESAFEKMATFLTPDSLAFAAKVMDRSGVSDDTYIHGWEKFPPECTFSSGRQEAETVITGAVDDLLAKTGVNPNDIGVVIVNISTYNPVPSLSAMIVNKYKLRQDVISYTLGGMGCSAGIIAVDLAKRLLQVRRNTHALVMSLECPSSSYYSGTDKSKLVPMCLFRMGGAAVLLSNRSSHRRISKYELKHTLRTHLGADDAAYNCVVQEPDDDGVVGVTLSKTLMAVAGEALRANITALGPSVLPISQQLRYVAAIIARKVLKMKGVKPFVPDFKLAFDHFCIHAGGKAVLDEVEQNLKLTKWDMEPSRMTLFKYSNTSSSSLWYELAYAEAKGRIKKGDRVWQIGFGSGFKCGSAVWTALRTIDPHRQDNPWTNIIHHFPVT
ncbi:hypothetical protein ACS0TY_003383 [Phlomoides rotata]